MYVLVLLHTGVNLADEAAHTAAHEAFIESLIERNLILLGGGFRENLAEDVEAAYVLRCADLAEARALVDDDPYVANGVLRPELAEWQLVGINRRAID